LIAGVQAGDTAVRQLIDTGATTLSKETRQALQRKLKDAGHYDGTVDGIIGEGTRRALARIISVTP
jgi:lysozyme family protein